MRIEPTKHHQSLLLFLCLLGLSLLTTACSSSSDECQSGYYRLDGVCVPSTTG
jgi:hypothetical protein